MARTAEPKTYDDVKMKCTWCGEPIPDNRTARGSVTCKKECADAREEYLRERKKDTECKYCHRPSSREDREAFLLFKKMARKRPDLLYPEEFSAWQIAWTMTFKEQTEQRGEEVDATSEAFQRRVREAFARYRNGNDDADREAAERPTGPPAAKSEPIQTHDDDSIYIFQQDQSGKKGQPCVMLKTRSSRRDIVQIRFADGYMPLVARSALRQPKASEINLVDEMRAAERTLAASGKPHAGE